MTPTLTEEEFALLGMGRMVYIRPITSAEAAELIEASATDADPDQIRYAIYMADGEPLMVVGDLRSTIVEFYERNVTPMRVH